MCSYKQQIIDKMKCRLCLLYIQMVGNACNGGEKCSFCTRMIKAAAYLQVTEIPDEIG